MSYIFMFLNPLYEIHEELLSVGKQLYTGYLPPIFVNNGVTRPQNVIGTGKFKCMQSVHSPSVTEENTIFLICYFPCCVLRFNAPTHHV